MPRDVKERYAKVKEYLASNPSPYFVDFDYIEDGILVNGKKYPISYMEWVEGVTLSAFLNDNINNSPVIMNVAQSFQVMVEELHRKHVSHGDLQDGNIMVCKNGDSISLKLVDYDSIFVPALRFSGIYDELLGVPDYQHPMRSKNANEKADYFSELVIYLSLGVYAKKPGLWKQGQEKKLLFSAEDFINTGTSPIFKILKGLSPDIQHLTACLEDYCSQTSTEQLLPLEALLQSSTDPPNEIYEFFGVKQDSNSPPHKVARRAAGGTPEQVDLFTPVHGGELITLGIPSKTLSRGTSAPPANTISIKSHLRAKFKGLRTLAHTRIAPWANAVSNASIVFGLIAWLLLPVASTGYSLVAAALAIITGHVAHMLSTSSAKVKSGKAVTGMIIGYAHIIPALILFVSARL